MIVMLLVAFPDDTCARMSVAEAHALMQSRGPRHGLRFYDATMVWNGSIGTDPYLAATVESNRRHAEPPTTLGSPTQRVRTIQSVADLPIDQKRQIAADGSKLGPEVAGRRWNLSKQSVVRVMKLMGLHKCPPTAREQRIFSRASL